MSIITDITKGVAGVDSALAKVGHASFASVGAAIDKALQDVKGAASASTEQIAFDIAAAAFPKLGSLIGVVEGLHKAFPNVRPANWKDPVWRADDDNPWADDNATDATKGQ